jgi:hypothetical protein
LEVDETRRVDRRVAALGGQERGLVDTELADPADPVGVFDERSGTATTPSAGSTRRPEPTSARAILAGHPWARSSRSSAGSASCPDPWSTSTHLRSYESRRRSASPTSPIGRSSAAGISERTGGPATTTRDRSDGLTGFTRRASPASGTQPPTTREASSTASSLFGKPGYQPNAVLRYAGEPIQPLLIEEASRTFGIEVATSAAL